MTFQLTHEEKKNLLEVEIRAINEASALLIAKGFSASDLDGYFERTASKYLTHIGEDNNDHNNTQLLNNAFDGFMSNEEILCEYELQREAEADYYNDIY